MARKTPTQEHFYSCVGVLLATLFEGVTQKFSFYENPFVAPPKARLFYCLWGLLQPSVLLFWLSIVLFLLIYNHWAATDNQQSHPQSKICCIAGLRTPGRRSSLGAAIRCCIWLCIARLRITRFCISRFCISVVIFSFFPNSYISNISLYSQVFFPYFSRNF